ncbi:unnamed protein product [Calicophoron daubneyi]|uniref:SHSP domain-containing protein n=1 Tax=Calicophoron daubneyi TaxID=300641 RepID=A0AAV2TZS4_CALDB
MSNYRTEMSIPVKRDPRSFEQSRKDMFSNLERTYSSSSTTTRTQRQLIPGGTESSDAVSSISTDSTLSGSRRPMLRAAGEWDDEVNSWLSESRRRWNEDIRRMKQEMFALECIDGDNGWQHYKPVDDFDLEHWGSSDPSSMMARMEQRMESLRQQMGSMSTFGDTPRLTGGSGQTIQSSTSRITTSSSTTSSGDPRGMVTKSNVQESVQHSRTVNGVTTGTSSQSKMSSTSTGQEAQKLASSGTPGALISQTSVPGGVMDFLKDAYELGEDGRMHFKVRFNAKDFAPEDIDVTTVENRLTVHAKKSIQSGGGSTSKEFCRTIDLPRSIDHEHFQCNLTEDGILILDAPVNAPDYKSITFRDDGQLGIRPKSQLEVQQSELSTKSQTKTLSVMGVSGPTILKEGTNGRKLHLEVPIDADYSAEDLCVRVDQNRIIVSGKKGNKEDSGRTTSKEFQRSFEIPETVDPFSVSAQLNDTTLIIEAPLLCTV